MQEVTIPLAEYQDLKRQALKLKALEELISIKECNFKGCQAIHISQLKMKATCETMHYCEVQDKHCLLEHYCDKHVEKLHALRGERSEETLLHCCNTCWESVDLTSVGYRMK